MMRGTSIRRFARAGLALLVSAVVTAALVAPASAQAVNPRNLLFELIDQLQTGRNRPVLYGPDVQRTIALQTNDTGVYQSLRQLGRISDLRLDRTQQLQGGHVFYMTATHANGPSSWEIGYSTRTERIDSFRFAAGGTLPPTNPIPTPPPAAPPVQPPPTASGKKPLAPPRTAGPPPISQPPVLPSVQPLPPVTPASTPTGPPPTVNPPGNDTSAACRKFPNLC